MLHSRTITLIALGCSLAALLVVTAVAVYFPDFQWWAVGSAVALFPIAAFARWFSWHGRGETPFQFLHAFKDAPAGLLLLDLGGRVKWANRCIEEILDQSLDEITDQAFADLLAGEAWETVQSQRQQLLKGGRIDLEGHMVTAGGRAIWTRAYANLVRSASGKPQFIVVQVLDLSATRNAESLAILSEARLHRTLQPP